MSPTPSYYHQQIVSRLLARLFTFVDQHKRGSVSVAPVDVVLSNENVVQPDLLFIASDRDHIITPNNVQGAPNLLIEVLSENNRRHDEVVKRRLYERYGVQEYWIVDPGLETVKIYRLIENAYGPPVLLSLETGDALDTPLLPEFHIPLDDIFVP